MHETRNSLSANIRCESVALLNKPLASAIECADAAETYSEFIAEPVQRAAQFSRQSEYPLGVAAEQHVSAVCGALAAFGESARKALSRAASFGDNNKADLFTEISRYVHQQLWLVESHGAAQ